VRTVATRDDGTAALLEALESHEAHLASTAERGERRARRARARLRTLLEERFRRAVEVRAPDPGGLEEAVARVAERTEDPYSAAERLFEKVVREPVGQ